MIPGDRRVMPGEIELNAGRKAVTLEVTTKSDLIRFSKPKACPP